MKTQKLNASDLMIGDWVHNKEGKNEQVTSLYDGYICTETHEDSHDYHFEPIPLTAEILKKNGFSRFGTYYGIFERERLIFPLTNPSSPTDYKDNYYLQIGNKDFPIKFVHQLQHALKLCGIDKQITL